MKNVYSAVLRATGAAHLGLLAAKLWVYPHPANILYKTGSNYLNSTTEHQLSNPSRVFPVLHCVWKQYEGLAGHDAFSGFKPSCVPSEASGTHKSWSRNA